MLLKLLFASIVVGVISGFLISIYELLVIFTKYFLFFGDPIKTVHSLPLWYIYSIPTIAIFTVNYFVSKDSNIKEYSINEITNSIMQNRMILKLKTLFLKIITSVISLASGFMVGTEGPSAGIGAMIAYHIHKLFKMPKFLIKMVISIGASSGIAAIFVSPLTGISFAVEYIAYQFLKRYIGYLLIASLIAFAISVNFLEPIYFMHSNGKVLNFKFFLSAVIFIPYILIFLYIYLFFKQKILHFIDLEIFKNAHKFRNYIFALIGGGTVGTILLLEPYAAFSGKEVLIYLINSNTHIPLSAIFVIIFLRIVGTTISIYSNAVGGMFLPLMSIGALAGYSYGDILDNLHLINEPFYFAAIGAAVFMGVIMKLPLTAVVLSLETTFDYNVVVATGIVLVFVQYLSSLKFDIKRKNINQPYHSANENEKESK